MTVSTEAPIHLLALSGSLRAASSNTALLRAATLLAPSEVEISLFEGIGALPHFNPDLNYADCPVLAELRARVKAADGLLISCPEYARGVPGSFKNALDWLVGGDEFIEKPVALFNASPRSSHAQAALRLTLETMSGRIIDEACLALPLLARGLDAAAIAADESLAAAIRTALAHFGQAARRMREEAARERAG